MNEQRQDPLVEEALRWLVVLKDKDASETDRQAFDHWLKLDPTAAGDMSTTTTTGKPTKG